MKKKYKASLSALVILLLWCLVSHLNVWSEYVFPSPQKVFYAFFEMICSGESFIHVFASLKRVIIGFSIAFSIALFLGIVLGINPKIEPYYNYIIEFTRNIPPISLIPILILWFGIGEFTKIIVIILAAFFPIFINIKKGILSCDKRLLEVGQIFGFNNKEILRKIILPQAVPDILIGMKIGLGYSWRAIIGAEMIAASKGIGYYILDAQLLSRSDKIIVGIFIIGILGCFFDYIFSKIVQKILRGGVDNRWY